MQKSHSKLSGFLRRSGLYLEIGLDVVKTYQQQRRARHALSRLKRQHFLGAGSQQGTGLLQVTTTGSGQHTGAGSGQQTGSGAGSGIEGRLQQRSNRPASKFSAAMTKVITAAMVNTNLFI